MYKHDIHLHDKHGQFFPVYAKSMKLIINTVICQGLLQTKSAFIFCWYDCKHQKNLGFKECILAGFVLLQFLI